MARDPLTTPWSGRAVEAARAIVAGWLPRPCGQCGEVVTAEDRWVVGHIKSRAEHPELTWEVSNWQVEHRSCSDKSGQAVVIAKAKAEAIRDAVASGSVLPATSVGGEPPPLPVSPSEDLDDPPIQPALPGMPKPATGESIEVRPELLWDPDRLRQYPWLAEYADVPDDASPPLYMSPPAPDAVGSYGADAIEWIEEVERKRLRWWQRLAITRQLECREDGTLCYEDVIDSAPRRAGKSVRMRGLALWRMADPLGLFGEPQLVMHTGSDLNICREIQRAAWVWAINRWGKDSVTKANGKEAIEDPTTGNRWLTRAQDAVYGYDVTYGMVDEGWNVKPATVTEGLEPATLERIMPQVHKTSTAHRRATSLMRAAIAAALAIDDPTVLLIIWAAPPGSDAGDPATWRAASPYWSEARHKLIARKYEKALAGEADPEADDPDPLAGFASQYLNVWRLNERRADPGDPLASEEDWAALGVALPDEVPTPAAAAIESWFGKGVSLGVAYSDGEGGAIVSVTDHATVAEAVERARALGYRRRLLVGKSLVEDPALKRRTVTPMAGSAGQSIKNLKRLITEDVLRHDGGEHLAGQVVAARTKDTAEGARVVSSGRADALKVADWAATAARANPSERRKPRVVTARK